MDSNTRVFTLGTRVCLNNNWNRPIKHSSGDDCSYTVLSYGIDSSSRKSGVFYDIGYGQDIKIHESCLSLDFPQPLEKFKVGDKVRVGKWKDLCDAFMVPYDEKCFSMSPLTNNMFGEDMRRCCGKVFEVTGVMGDDMYFLSDGSCGGFHACFLELVK